MAEIQKQESGEAPPHYYAWWQLYGEQKDGYDFHRNGFTPKRLQGILELLGIFEDVEVETGDEGQNLYAKARKVTHPEPFALTPAWDEIQEREGIAFPGLKPLAAPVIEVEPDPTT